MLWEHKLQPAFSSSPKLFACAIAAPTAHASSVFLSSTSYKLEYFLIRVKRFTIQRFVSTKAELNMCLNLIETWYMFSTVNKHILP